MTGTAKSPTPVVQRIRGTDLIQCCHSEDGAEGGEFECGWATPGTGLAADVRYESSWWQADVIAHIRAHRQQLLTDVKARTTGVPTLRRTGRTRAERHAESEAP